MIRALVNVVAEGDALLRHAEEAIDTAANVHRWLGTERMRIMDRNCRLRVVDDAKARYQRPSSGGVGPTYFARTLSAL